MNGTSKDKHKIFASHLGPIESLDGELSKHRQNLIFARNGVGKSFLSRAFRCLDDFGQGKDLKDAPDDIISEESLDGKGAFTFSEGTMVIGKVELDRGSKTYIVDIPDTIFHVFSDDFIQKELRERKFDLDGDIEHQITVSSKEIDLSDAKQARDTAETDKNDAIESLKGKFDTAKNDDLVGRAKISRNLTEYKDLNFDKLLENVNEKPSPPAESMQELRQNLSKLAAIPEDPKLPQEVVDINPQQIDFDALEDALRKVTSPSAVADDIKLRIETNPDFFKAGTALIETEGEENCPFCAQDITSPEANELIQIYLTYFAAEEEKHRDKIRGLKTALNGIETNLSNIKSAAITQLQTYEKFSQDIPSLKDSSLEDVNDSIAAVRNTVEDVVSALDEKMNNLAAPQHLSMDDLRRAVDTLNAKIQTNSSQYGKLVIALSQLDTERRDLQRKVCETFETEFVIAHWGEFENIKSLEAKLTEKSEAWTELKNSAPSQQARDRIAETFEKLIKHFFPKKYVFDRTNFSLKRGKAEMKRGVHRTLSDGEKTVIAFCYFIASLHLKVQSDTDYDKLFFVFDDPVTSMSYDFIFSIAQVLRYFTISSTGDVELFSNPSENERPKLLVLTHSTYLFNILVGNKAIENGASFCLQKNDETHEMARFKKYLAPFQHQIRDIVKVANGECEPNHTTANSVRSVLEAIGRFCRPDQDNFFRFLADESNIKIRSTLIHNQSHGTFYEESPDPEDLKQACKDTVSVIEEFAYGQLHIIGAT